GHIGGLNGLLLGAALEAGIRGACLLGEIPQMLAQLPFPKASLAVLEKFVRLAEIDLDLGELHDQVAYMDERIGELMADVERAMGPSEEDEDEFLVIPDEAENRLDPEDERRIEELFAQALSNRSKAYELK